jgi:hypothetical protein
LDFPLQTAHFWIAVSNLLRIPAPLFVCPNHGTFQNFGGYSIAGSCKHCWTAAETAIVLHLLIFVYFPGIVPNGILPLAG